jgi:hypothetical protein
MTDLLVDRMYVRAAASGPADEARLHTLLADLTGRRLDEAFAAVTVLEGHWCLRRVAVTLPDDPMAADATVTRSWARAVIEALTTALATAADPIAARSADLDVVHYARPRAARTDLVAELALGRTQRAWAWRAVGVLTGTDPDPATAPAEAALAVLAADRGATLPVLVGAVQRAGLAAVHRLLGGPGWARLADLALDGHGAGDGARAARGRSGSGRVARAGAPDPRPTATAVLARSTLAAACRGGRVRPTPAVARAWALLALAEAEPAALRRQDLDAVLDLVAATLDPRAGTPAPRAHRPAEHADPEPGHGAPADPTGAPADDRGPGGTTSRDDPPTRGAAVDAVAQDAVTPAALDRSGPLPAATRPVDRGGTDDDRSVGRADARADAVSTQPRPGPSPDPSPLAPSRPDPAQAEPAHPAAVGPALHPTAWGGLVYLLATAAEAGVPDVVLDDDRLRERPASWLLFHLLRLLIDPAPDVAVDPTVRVLAGLAPDAPAPEPEPAPTELAALLGHAAGWARVTADRLGDDAGPGEVVRRIAARIGAVAYDPGWIELHLRLDDVDIAVRRAGLDVDPGFVPWLGAVVVIRYG